MNTHSLFLMTSLLNSSASSIISSGITCVFTWAFCARLNFLPFFCLCWNIKGFLKLGAFVLFTIIIDYFVMIMLHKTWTVFLKTYFILSSSYITFSLNCYRTSASTSFFHLKAYCAAVRFKLKLLLYTQSLSSDYRFLSAFHLSKNAHLWFLFFLL